jgi:hypothetical protein
MAVTEGGTYLNRIQALALGRPFSDRDASATPAVPTALAVLSSQKSGRFASRKVSLRARAPWG